MGTAMLTAMIRIIALKHGCPLRLRCTNECSMGTLNSNTLGEVEQDVTLHFLKRDTKRQGTKVSTKNRHQKKDRKGSKQSTGACLPHFDADPPHGNRLHMMISPLQFSPRT